MHKNLYLKIKMNKYANVEMWITFPLFVFCQSNKELAFDICVDKIYTWVNFGFKYSFWRKFLDNINLISPLALAFVGDSVHTLFVREHIIKNNIQKINDYHKLASHFCKASTQSKVLELLMPNLSQEELEVVRRARNTKIHLTAKNASLKDYKMATSFEAVVGYLYLTKQEQRLQEILKFSIGEKI